MKPPFDCYLGPNRTLVRVHETFWDRHWLVQPLAPWTSDYYYMDITKLEVRFA